MTHLEEDDRRETITRSTVVRRGSAESNRTAQWLIECEDMLPPLFSLLALNAYRQWRVARILNSNRAAHWLTECEDVLPPLFEIDSKSIPNG